jgi:hypothetical protein
MKHSDHMEEQINRLGFDAWADNKFVNILEDIVGGSDGHISIEHGDYHILATWNEETVNCCIRAYTGNGWEVYEKQTKR